MTVKGRGGYEGQLFIGNPGFTATTQLKNVIDLSYDTTDEEVEITSRNILESNPATGATVSRSYAPLAPVASYQTLKRNAQITWQMINRDDDLSLASLVAAARSGFLVALRTKAYANGKGFDGDCKLAVSHEMSLKGISTYSFTAKPNDSLRNTQLDI
jgi:hypothetical protein